jgi:hypothetical protein
MSILHASVRNESVFQMWLEFCSTSKPVQGFLSCVTEIKIIFVCDLSDKPCNPGFLGVIGLKSESTFDSQSIVGLVIWMCCVLYSSLRTASSSSKITMAEHVLVKDNQAGMYYDHYYVVVHL